MQSQDTNELFEALAKAQAEMTGAKKDSENPFFKSKYADLHAVLEAVKEPLAKNNLCVIQTVNSPEIGSVVVTTTLGHKSGQWINGNCPVINTKGDAQGMGSAITYARRYSLAAICGIAQMDDDGNAAVQQREQISPEPINRAKVDNAVIFFKAQIDMDSPEDTHDKIKAHFKTLSNDEKIAAADQMTDKAPNSNKMYKSLLKDHLGFLPTTEGRER